MPITINTPESILLFIAISLVASCEIFPILVVVLVDCGRDLFDPFFRSEDARLNHPGGTGLGLALARRVVGWHSGSIRAFNRSGGGLVVQILLPIEASFSLDRERSFALATSD